VARSRSVFNIGTRRLASRCPSRLPHKGHGWRAYQPNPSRRS
jgi:hypothetical protein